MMSDIQITIGAESRNFNLAKSEQAKLWTISEIPIVPVKAAVDNPSYGNLPPERILVFTQGNWHGGMGQLKYDIPDKYAIGQNIDTRELNQIFLGPLINTIGEIADTIIALEFFKSREYAASTTKVYKLNADSTTWVTVLTIAGDTIECLNQYDGQIFCGLTTGKYWYSTTGESEAWTQCTLSNAVAHLFAVCPPFTGTKDLFVLARRPNELRTSIEPLNGGTGWVDPPYYIGDNTANIRGLFVLNGVLLVGKEDGLYHLSSDGRPQQLLPEFKHKRSADNFRYDTNWQASLYASLAGDIVEIASYYTIDYMGPLEKSPSLAMTGSVRGLASDDKNIYAVLLVGSNYIIYTGRERRDEGYGLRWEWVPYIFLSNNVCGAVKVMQRDGANPKLWFAYGTNMANVILSRSPNYPLGDANYRFCAQGYLITSYFDAGYNTWQKIFYQLWTMAENLTATINVKVYSQKDTATDWTLLATITSNGIQSVNLSAIACKRIRLKIELNSNDSTKTPILNEFIFRGVLQPENTRLLDFTVALEQSATRKPSADLAFLRSGRQSSSPITLKDLRFGTTRYVIFLPGSPTETEVTDIETKQPSYGAKIYAQELNWAPP